MAALAAFKLEQSVDHESTELSGNTSSPCCVVAAAARPEVVSSCLVSLIQSAPTTRIGARLLILTCLRAEPTLINLSDMIEPKQNIREYLAQIGSRGGKASRRKLTPSHAKWMVAIRELKRATLKAGDPWPPADPQVLKFLKLR